MKLTLPMNSLCRHVAAITGLVLASGAITLSAADRTWNGGGDQSSWSDAANWGGTAPVANDNLFFDGSVGLNNYNDIAANTTFGGITFNTGASAFTMAGNAITLGGGITNSSSVLQDMQFNMALSAARTVYAGGDVSIDGSVNSTSSKYPLVKYGPGTLTIGGTADNGYGSAEARGGVLVLAKASSGSIHAIGGNCTVYTNGTLRFAGTGGDQVYYNANFVMNGGILQVQASEEIASLGGAPSTASIVENGLANSTNTLTLGSNNGRRGIYNGTIRDNGGVLNLELHRNNNEQVLNGTNTYSGTTLVDNTQGSGTSRLIVNGLHTGGGAYTVWGNGAANLAALAGGGSISATVVDINDYGILAPGGSLSGEGSSATYSETTAILTISNAVNLNTANASLAVDLNGTTPGTGCDQVNIAGSGTFSNNAANLKITVGSVSVGDKFTIVKVQGIDPTNNIGAFASLNGTPTDLSQGAIFLDPSSGKSLQISYRAEGSTFDAGAGNGNDIMLQVVNPVGGANLTWRGNGTDNNWDVTTTADWWNGTSLVTFTNGDFVSFDNSGSNNIPLNLVGDLSPSTFNVNATNNYILAGSGKLTGTVVLTKTNSGTFTLATDNDYVGTTLIQNGTLQLGTNGTTGSITVAATINSGGTLAYNRSDDIVITNPAFSGTGSVIQKGGGKMTIAANITSGYSGTTYVQGGELRLGDGSSTVGSISGTVSIGNTNVLRYYHNGTGANSTVANSLAGNGTVIYDYAGIIYQTYTISTTIGSSNFTGTNILKHDVRISVASDGIGYALGNGGVVDATASGSQVSLGRNSIPYNQTFLVSGQGWSGQYPYTGALNLYRDSISGPIILMGDTRINPAGVTISGQISGPYNLEIVGATNGYPNDALILNPTNGANSYGNTLVTQGFVRAQNSGALGTNGLAVDLYGRLDVYGTTITVANLQNGASGGGFIDNGSSASNATLVVGTDNSSTTFDGFFGNGSSKALNLTKVGAGTLTLSGVSTNTGTVSVNGGALALSSSGSFDNAAAFAVASGATLDVTGRGDGTLTLTANQTLKHSGASLGTISITGNLNMGSGILLLGLNRTNPPATNDSLSVSGTLTAGGTLTVTNLGPVLHVNDSFTLLSPGFGGVFTYNLQTNDYVNNVKYTWNNTVSSNGKITVASVSPLVNSNPPQVQLSVSGNTLHLGWPTNAGWTLLTNSVGLSATNQWFPYPNSANLTNVDILMDPAKTNVFFRMVYPYP